MHKNIVVTTILYQKNRINAQISTEMLVLHCPQPQICKFMLTIRVDASPGYVNVNVFTRETEGLQCQAFGGNSGRRAVSSVFTLITIQNSRVEYQLSVRYIEYLTTSSRGV